MLFSPQIPLQLAPSRAGGFDEFVAGPNGSVVAAVKSVLDDPEASLFLYGGEGSGKTHLLNAVCLAAREQGMTAFYLGLKRLPSEATESLQGLENMDLVCVDDVHAVAGEPAWEEALFHFINRLRAARGRLVVASRERLRNLPLGLPDLGSRLAWGLRMELQPLDDEQKLSVLCRRAESMGFELPEDVASYLIRRSERSLAGLLVKVDRLRHAAFTEKRRITVPLAREVLRET